MHFFQPKVHYQGPEDGKAVSEMPILNYSVAALWKVFGEHEYIYRLVEYIIYLMGIFVLFNTVGIYGSSWLMAFFTVCFLLTSPLLTFYSLNFLADVPALSLGIISFCLFYRFYRTQRLSLFYLSLFCGTLAVLMKASALMALGILIFFSLADILRLDSFFKSAALFRKKLLPAICIGVSVLGIFLWYRFALQYNVNKTNNVFLLTVLPIWEMEEAEIIYKLKTLCNSMFPLFMNKPMLFLFFILVFYVIARFRSLSVFFKYSFIFTAVYFLSYLVFFFQVFDVHDYYLNNLMIFPVVTLMSFTDLVTRTTFIAQNKIFIRLSLIILFLFSGFHAAATYRLRMIEDDKLTYWFPFIDKEELKLFKFYHWDYSRDVKNIEEFRPILRAHGIKRTDQVLSIPDQSFDISLYFMDQKGHGISREHFQLDSMVIDHFRNRNISYVVMSDTTLKRETAFKRLAPHLEDFFTSGRVQVFKVKPDFK
jgi:hypothetical protein